MEGTARLAIGKLAKHTGTNVETIRYYERMGLWTAPWRSPSGYRLYGTEHLKRLNFIRRARLLGFSVGEVRTLLKLADERKRPCAEVRVVAEAHLTDVRTKIADLRSMERVLEKTVARCADGAGSDCALIDALYRVEPLTPAANMSLGSSTRSSTADGRGSRSSGRTRKRIARPTLINAATSAPTNSLDFSPSRLEHATPHAVRTNSTGWPPGD